MRNNLVSILLKEPFQVKQVIGKIHPNQLRQVLVFATRSKNWKLRRNSIELLGTVASAYRMDKDNERHFQVLQSFRNLPEIFMKLATRDKNEAVQSSAAWALGQVNDWPEIFHERVLRPTSVAGHVGIDTSLPFLPPGGDSGCVRSREAIKLAKQFIPHFDGHGFEMRWDTRDLYLGPYYRVLKDPESPRKGRCIEYFFMWSRQNWPISLFFSSYFWPLLSLLALFQRETNLHSPAGWLAGATRRRCHPHCLRLVSNSIPTQMFQERFLVRCGRRASCWVSLVESLGRTLCSRARSSGHIHHIQGYFIAKA